MIVFVPDSFQTSSLVSETSTLNLCRFNSLGVSMTHARSPGRIKVPENSEARR